jgi:histone acetyltransferase (RNA polymerase elongator complex component)
MNPPEKPLVIPIFIPHSGCPHQCAFCNQSIIAREAGPLPDHSEIQEIVQHYLKFKGWRKKVEIAFFGGNFLGLDPRMIVALLEHIEPYIREKKIDGIRFSTRPDTITKERLALIAPYPVSAVEIGVQSMNDAVLSASGRGHESLDTVKAMALLKQIPVKIGVQVMAGLPKDNEISLLESTREIAGLCPDFARIYPLMVLKGSRMEKWYAEGRYQPLALAEAVQLVKHMYRIFRTAGVEVIRMGLQASEMMEDASMVLAGPWHPAFGHLVFSEMLYDLVCERLDQCPDLLTSEEIGLRVHPRAVPRLRGERNNNMKKLNLDYPNHRFRVLTDEGLSMDEIEIF